MSTRIAYPTKTIPRAAAALLSLFVSACAQTTRGSIATTSGDSSRAPASSAANSSTELSQGMMVRISEIQIEPNRLDEYKAILTEEAEASVRLEPV